MPAVAIGLLQVAGQTACIYLGLIVGIHVLGQRAISQLSAPDILVILLLGSAVETAMVAGNTSLLAGMVSAGILLLCDRLLTLLLRRWPALRRLVLGGPLLLVHQGQPIMAHLRRIGLTEADLLEEVREHGLESLAEAQDVVQELDGSISVIARSGRSRRGHDGA